MPLSDGQTFAGYRVLRLLGSGGMGEVYLAKHPRLPRLDALKVLRVDVSANAEYRARFEREADLASTLWQPNVVGVHDRGEFENQLWISMDYIDGSDAGKLLRQRFPAGMPSADVCAIATAVASALDYAHKRGLLHRDVKPANIMITHDDDGNGEKRILLADFGVARAIGDVSGLTVPRPIFSVDVSRSRHAATVAAGLSISTSNCAERKPRLPQFVGTFRGSAERLCW
jgi:serine/threonine protein kinase, bacterial